MRPDPHAAAQIGALLWLGCMAGLLHAAPLLGVPGPKTPGEVLGAGVALALLLGAAIAGAWHRFDE